MKGLASLRRADWLKELQAVLIIGLVVVGGLSLLGATATVGDSLSMQLPASAVSGTVDHELRDGVRITAEQEVTVAVADPGLRQRVVGALTALPTQVVVIALLALLLRIVWYARRSDPFTLDTVRRLRVLAVVSFAGGYLAVLVELIATMYLSSTVTAEAVVGYTRLPLHWFLIGFGLFAIAEVVKRGCAMRDELETVV